MLENIPPTTSTEDIFISIFSNNSNNCNSINTTEPSYIYEDDTDFSLAPSCIIDHHNQFNYATHLNSGCTTNTTTTSATLERVDTSFSNLTSGSEDSPFDDLLQEYNGTELQNPALLELESTKSTSSSSSSSASSLLSPFSFSNNGYTSSTTNSSLYSMISYTCDLQSENNIRKINNTRDSIFQSQDSESPLNYSSSKLHPLMNSYLPTNPTTETYNDNTMSSSSQQLRIPKIILPTSVDLHKNNSSHPNRRQSAPVAAEGEITTVNIANVLKPLSIRSKTSHPTRSTSTTTATSHSNLIPNSPLSASSSYLSSSSSSTASSTCGSPSPFSSNSPAYCSSSPALGQNQQHRGERDCKKISDSRLSAEALARVLKLNSAEEAREIEKQVLQCLSEGCGFPLGYKTWVRDTTKSEREEILQKLFGLINPKYPQYSIEILEKIIRRATYYMMQSRLRRERRAKVKAQSIK